jgi:two-component system sensor histidine kinase ChiS
MISRRVYLFITTLFVASALFAQTEKDIPFKHLTVMDGLSISNVNWLMQDSKGFMWFGTSNGLNKYDGYSFTIYNHDPSDPSSISANNINDIIEDQNGNLWIATFQGLNMYDRKKDSFIRYRHDPSAASGIISNNIQCIKLDHNGDLWIGTDRGLSRLDIQTKRFVNYSHSDNDSGSLAHNDISVILEAHDGLLLIGTRGEGVETFDPKRNTFTHHYLGDASLHGHNDVLGMFEDHENAIWVATQQGLYARFRDSEKYVQQFQNSVLKNQAIFRLVEDHEGDLWVSVENEGIYVYNKKTDKLTHLQHTSDPTSLSNNAVSSMYRDRGNNIWVGTYTGGINVFDAKPKQFVHHKNYSGDANNLSHNSILSFAEDGDRGIWLGTDGGGLEFFDRDKNSYTHHLAGGNANTISGNHVGSLLLDKDDRVWSAAWGGGINVYSKQDRTFKHYKNVFSDSTSLSSNYCFDIYEDHNGDIWVGTMGAGLNLLQRGTNKFIKYLPNANANSIISKLIYSIYEDRDENLWIGTEDMGLSLLDRKKNLFKHFVNEENNPRSISNNTINVMLQDSNGNLWIGTNGGLNKFDYVTKSFTTFLEKDGLPSRVVKSIELDDHGNLWLGTTKGISKFDPAKNIFRNYTITDGLQGSEFNRQASLKSKNGEMYFGGNNGFNTFFPDSVKHDSFNPPVVFTNFLIFNKPQVPGALGSVLPSHIGETDAITLTYKESVFTIEFAAVECIHPEEVKYAYMLEGFDKTWNYVDAKRSATYTQMDPGQYTFKVKVANSNGEWGNHIKEVRITIVPPFWATVWFKFTMVLLVVACILAFIRIRLYSLRKQKEELEKKVIEKNLSLQKHVKQQEKLLTEKEWLIKEIHHRVKNNFHIVTGLLSTQASYLKNDEALRAIEQSQQRIHAMSLIHQKLYQSENLSALNMPDYIHELVEYLKDCFETKRHIRFDLQIEPIVLDLSYSLPIGLILNEAITNAIKYAFRNRDQGVIAIALKRTNDITAVLSIHDNGIGFSPDFDLQRSSSMGMNLMRGLSEDINGVFSITSNDGTQVDISFPTS